MGGNASFRAELLEFARARDRLGSDVARRDALLAQRPPEAEPDPFCFGPPDEAWRALPIVSGQRVRLHICGNEWREGIVSINEGMCNVALDDGGEDQVPEGSP